MHDHLTDVDRVKIVPADRRSRIEKKVTTNKKALKMLNRPHINCVFCNIGDGCNGTKKKPHSDRYKNHREGLKK